MPGPSVRPYLCTAVPDASYRWRSARNGARVNLTLEARTPEGVAAGLYGLLQEKIGFRFVHPRETIIPSYTTWPLPLTFTFSGSPRFEKRGFHLHTQHPIELTEQLLNPETPRAHDDVKEYIDWLARNGQNTFQFFLLRGVDKKTWPHHARKIVEYAHSRGIRCGIQISLAMIQQQAYQAITLLWPFPSYEKQVDRSLAWLFQAPWDYVSLDVTMGEHLPFIDRILPDVQMHIEQQVEKKYGARLMYATHVICSENGDKVRRPKLPNSGIMLHTVMCYSASEEQAPVYGNRNQRFMLEAATVESKRRETWYWPESSYWVAFDSSVPLLLLPYLDSRWRDIETMSRLGLSGHLTFSSGWEWGYWLVDWSIARWSWRYTDNGVPRKSSPLSRLQDLVNDEKINALWKETLELQNRYLKDRELLRYLSALAPFSELPHPFDKPFQPEPSFSYSWLLDKASQAETDAILKGPVMEMESYAASMESAVRRLANRLEELSRNHEPAGSELKLLHELKLGLEITALRARHRSLSIRALLAKRAEHTAHLPHSRVSEPLLQKATAVRIQAMNLVRSQEKLYRYPLEQIARRHDNMTAYQFGYLYPVANLFFWQREEEQVRQERFDAFFMNLWDFRRIVGLGSLILK
ncbi:MAG TPA: hypothetical protein HPP94_09185 [Desulfuromonadales bacterium]|nr:hypothetical protein [Desulfuromonadales bacterium]